MPGRGLWWGGLQGTTPGEAGEGVAIVSSSVLEAGITTNGAPGSCARQQVWVKEDIWGEATWRAKVLEPGEMQLVLGTRRNPV